MNPRPPSLTVAQQGVLLALVSGVVWGLAPLYFRWVGAASPVEIVLHRVVWSVPLLALALTVTRRWPEVRRVVRDRRRLATLVLSAVLIAVNWFVFVYAVSTRQVVEASLGYFINPLFSAALGVLVLRERPRPLGWCALAIAALGVGNELLQYGAPPWIALTLAGSFGTYGLVRKQVGVASDAGLFLELLVLLPCVLPALGWMVWSGQSHFGNVGALSVGLMLGSLVTVVPLMCFAGAALRLPLTTLSFFQYLSPSISLALAVGVFHEPLGSVRALTFGAIWLALFVSAVDVLRQRRRPAVARLADA